MRGKSNDMGEVIKKSILRAIQMGTRGGLPHLSLICGLCYYAGVKWGGDEPLLHPMPLIDHSLIIRYKVWGGSESDPKGLRFIIPRTAPQEEGDLIATVSTIAEGTSSQRFDKTVRRWMNIMDVQHDELVRQNIRIAQHQDVIHSYNGNFNVG